MINTAFKNKKALVTGCAGFIGSHITEALLGKGAVVTGLDNLSTGFEQNMSGFIDNPRFKFIRGDIRDFSICEKAAAGVNYILHQAAACSVPGSMLEPALYTEVNVNGTNNIFEAARVNKVECVVYASSAAVYGDSDKPLKIEGEEGAILSPYALTKKITELYGDLYTRVFNVKCIGLRYFNVYGKRQSPDNAYAAVIPAFISKLLKGESCVINGDGNQTRDFIHISDVVKANLTACMACDKAGGMVFNAANGDVCTINDLYNIICLALGITREPVYGPPREGDITHSRADISRIINILGYKPNINLTDGMKETVEWYKADFIKKENI